MSFLTNKGQATNKPLISNPDALLLLAVFNVALLLNFYEMLWKIPLLLALMLASLLMAAFNPKWWWAHFLNLLISFYIFAGRFPRQANHANLEFLIELVILALLGYRIFRPKIQISKILISWIFRICLVTIYFYTGFHKLNTDFFNPCVSCVNTINDYALSNLTGRDFTVSAALSRFFQYVAVFTEMVLPLGLLFAKTRKWAAMALLAFHFYLAFTVFADFSALAVFLILGCFLDFESTVIDPKIRSGLRIYLGFAAISVLLFPFLPKTNIAAYHWSFVHGLVYNIGLLFLLVPVFCYGQPSAQSVRKRHLPVLAACILLISCWSLKSYIGLGNVANLTMFSNLLTEKSRSNHFLLDTKKTKIFDFEEDNVLIIQLPPQLKNLKLEQYKLPVVEFKYQAHRWISKYHGARLSCTYVYKNDTITIRDLSQSGIPEIKWWYRFLNFRKIQPQGANECYW